MTLRSRSIKGGYRAPRRRPRGRRAGGRFVLTVGAPFLLTRWNSRTDARWVEVPHAHRSRRPGRSSRQARRPRPWLRCRRPRGLDEEGVPVGLPHLRGVVLVTGRRRDARPARARRLVRDRAGRRRPHASRPSSAPSRRLRKCTGRTAWTGLARIRRSPRSSRESGGALAPPRCRRPRSSTRSSSRCSRRPATGSRAIAIAPYSSLGWSGAFRRAELVSLDAGDVVRGDEGLVVTLRRSKGDQEGTRRGQRHPVRVAARCLPRARARALAGGRRHRRGPDLPRDRPPRASPGERLHPSSVARIVKRCAERAGFDRRSSPGTRSGRGSRRPRRSAASPSTRSCGRRCTAPSAWRVRTSGTRSSSTTTPQGGYSRPRRVPEYIRTREPTPVS